MQVPNQRLQSVSTHDFAMNPRSDVPRSVFPINHGVKQPFNFSDLVPVLIEEVLPGDTWKCGINVVARTAVPIVPIQDNWHLELFTFFVPMRILWDNARKFWGEQDNPGDSIGYQIPQIVSPVGGFSSSSVYDYMGLPTVGQIGGANTISINALPLRAYNRVWNEWFRDENLQNRAAQVTNDGPDTASAYIIRPRGKRFDYITQALPWPQKGNTAITIPLGSTAPLQSTGVSIAFDNPSFGRTGTGLLLTTGSATPTWSNSTASPSGAANFGPNNAPVPSLRVDLSTASGASINAMRQAITLQQYLEKDARGGTRYTEFVFNHFGVRSPDARLQRPEFIGGGHVNILTTAIPQTSATGLTGGTTPAGNLAATGHLSGKSGFTYSATEHGFILTVVSARAELTYQQGLRKMWSRSTRLDYPVPLLANLGEQTLFNREIYCDGSATDTQAFGYVPRWDEYRHIPSRITGLYRSTTPGTLDYWHSAERFTTLPTLNDTFIQDPAKTVTQRNFAAGPTSANQQLLADFYFSGTMTRALPAYGIPGLTRL